MWWSYFKSHGPNCQTVQFDNFGLRCVFTHDPENIKAVLSTQFEDFGKGSDFHRNWEPFLGDSIFTSDGPQWRASRQLIRPQFLKERVSDLSIFERHVQVLLKHILSLGNGASVELNDLFFRFTLETSTEFLFGQTTGSIENPDDEFSKAFAEVQRIQALIMTAGSVIAFLQRLAMLTIPGRLAVSFHAHRITRQLKPSMHLLIHWSRKRWLLPGRKKEMSLPMRSTFSCTHSQILPKTPKFCAISL